MFSAEAAGSSEEGVKLVKESENESGSALDCAGPSGRPSDWLRASLPDASRREGAAASVLPSPRASAVLVSGTWAEEKRCN